MTLSVVVVASDQAAVTRPLYLDLIEDAVYLADDGTMRRVLDGLRERMRALGSERIFLPDGSWYWDLKPDLVPGEVVEL